MTKKKVEVYIDGQENNIIYMKENLKKGKGMEKVHFGGKMDQNIVDSFSKVNKQVLEFCIGRAIQYNIKEHG